MIKRGIKSRRELKADAEGLLVQRESLKQRLEYLRRLSDQLDASITERDRTISGLILAAERLAAMAVKGRKPATVAKLCEGEPDLVRNFIETAAKS